MWEIKNENNKRVVSCANCGKEIDITRVPITEEDIRYSVQICSRECLYEFIDNFSGAFIFLFEVKSLQVGYVDTTRHTQSENYIKEFISRPEEFWESPQDFQFHFRITNSGNIYISERRGGDNVQVRINPIELLRDERIQLLRKLLIRLFLYIASNSDVDRVDIAAEKLSEKYDTFLGDIFCLSDEVVQAIIYDTSGFLTYYFSFFD